MAGMTERSWTRRNGGAAKGGAAAEVIRTRRRSLLRNIPTSAECVPHACELKIAKSVFTVRYVNAGSVLAP